VVDVKKHGKEDLRLREFHIHDGESGRLQCKLDCKLTERQLMDVAFSPDGRTLATVFDEKHVYGPGQPPFTENDVVLWNVESGARLAILPGHKSYVFVVAFSPDGKKLLSGDAEGMIRIWDVETKKEQIAFQAHKSRIDKACFSGDGSMIATSPGPDVTLWNTQTGQEILSHSLPDGPAKLLRFVAGDKALLTFSRSGMLRTWPIDPLAHLNQRGFRFRSLTKDERKEFGIAADASK
jgi:WD40 repeat protein